MRTAQWESYTGPGRIAVSPAPKGTRQGYRLSPVMFVGPTPSAPEIQASFLLADARAVWRILHVTSYPYEPVLMGAAPPEVDSYRVQLARWISFHTGEHISELDPATHRARKQRRLTLHGLPGSGSVLHLGAISRS